MYGHFCEAADSVLAQTHDNVELVVVVDGSPDVYEQVINDYADHDNVTTKRNKKNVGLLVSRNRGAEVASGDVVAFIDDDAVADDRWVERLVQAYEREGAIAAGGKMTPRWVAGKPSYLPEEFYWLVGVTHKGFADGPSEVRNTFGSNISFRADVFNELGGFNQSIGGRKGDANLQGGETELCARLHRQYDRGVWYDPTAKVAHKVFDYRTEFSWLVDRAFWQGYSKRAMDTLVESGSDDEEMFLRRLMIEFIPRRLSNLIQDPSFSKVTQLITLFIFTGSVGVGYIYGFMHY